MCVDDECFLDSSWKGCAHDTSQGVPVTARMDWSRDDKQAKMSAESLGVVYRKLAGSL